MNIFDFNNPNHIKILKEELASAKLLLEQAYNADSIWDSMTQDDRKSALYVAKSTNPDELLNSSWDMVPSDTQDLIDLGDYELAKHDQGGRTNLRAITSYLKSMPNLSQLTDKFLSKVGRKQTNELTVKQSYTLLIAIQKFINKMAPNIDTSTLSTNVNPRDMPGGGPSTGYLGSKWTGD